MMNTHTEINYLLPEYAAGRLPEDLKRAVEAHLPGCEECRQDLALWTVVGGELVAEDHAVKAPVLLAEGALMRVRSRRPQLKNGFQRTVNLLCSQLALTRRDIWPATVVIMIIGTAMCLVAQKTEGLAIIAPLVAAACIAVIFNPEQDPAVELTLSTPTPFRQILLARLALVFFFNLLLAMAASLVLGRFIPGTVVSTLVLGWLGPMAFLSTSALMLSVWFGSDHAIVISYATWLAQFIAGNLLKNPDLANQPLAMAILGGYQLFWQTPLWLLAGAAILLGVTLAAASRLQFRAPHLA